MHLARFALFALAPAVVVAGCLPLSDAGGLSFLGEGGTQAGAGGFGGGNNATIKTNTATGAGGEGAANVITPWLSFLCGGSTATCVPGLTSDECAPGGNPNMGPPLHDGGSKLTCQLVAGEGTAEAKCTMAGSGGPGDPCTQATDCGVGLGCLAADVVNVCQYYCCGDPELCPEHTYCKRSPMAELPAVEIPLCVKAKTCDLLNPNDHTCGAGEMCAIVRNDGTTSCIPEPPADKAGGEGDSCPCKEGYMCSNATGTCVKLCHVGSDECGEGVVCQGGSNPYPPTIGYCVR